MAEDVTVIGIGFDPSGLRAGAAAGTAALGALSRAAEAAGVRMNALTASAGGAGAGLKGMAAGAAAGAAAMGAVGIGIAKATNRAGEFGDELGRVATLLPGNTDRVEELGNELLDLEGDIEDTTRALFQQISAFGDQEGTVLALQDAYKASVAGHTSLESAINLTIAATKAYGDTTRRATREALDLAFITNKIGVTSFPELASSLGSVVSVSSQLGITIEEVFASFAALTGTVGNTNETATATRSIMSDLLSPSGNLESVMSDLMETMGAQTPKQLIAQLGGFLPTLQRLREEAEETGITLGELFQNRRSQRGIGPLLGAQTDKFLDALAEMRERAEGVDQAFEDATTGLAKLSHEQERFGQIVDKTVIKIGKRFAGEFADAFESGTEFIKENQNAIVEWGVFAGRAVHAVGQTIATIVRVGFNAVTGLASGLAAAWDVAAANIQGHLNNVIRLINRMLEAGAAAFEFFGIGDGDAPQIALFDLEDNSRRARAQFEAVKGDIRDMMSSLGNLGDAWQKMGEAELRAWAATRGHIDEASAGVDELQGKLSGGDPFGLARTLDFFRSLSESTGGGGTDPSGTTTPEGPTPSTLSGRTRDLERLNDVSGAYRDHLREMRQEIERGTRRTERFKGIMARSFSGLVIGADRVEDAFRRMVDGMLDAISRRASGELVDLLFEAAGIGAIPDRPTPVAPGDVRPPSVAPQQVAPPTIAARRSAGGSGETVVVDVYQNIEMAFLDARHAEQVAPMIKEFAAQGVQEAVARSRGYRDALRGRR